MATAKKDEGKSKEDRKAVRQRFIVCMVRGGKVGGGWNPGLGSWFEFKVLAGG